MELGSQTEGWVGERFLGLSHGSGRKAARPSVKVTLKTAALMWNFS